MSKSKKKSPIIIKGDKKILIENMDELTVSRIKDELTVSSYAYQDQPGTVVRPYKQSGSYLHVPRHFIPRSYPVGDFTDRTTLGNKIDAKLAITLMESRGQPMACASMCEHLRLAKGGILKAPTGTGKCLGKGTEVILYDGRAVMVETIKAGDLLMGPDGKSRRVLSTVEGSGELYKIEPKRGEPWICNDAHILTLVDTVSGAIKDVSIQEWLNASKTFRHCHKQFSVGVDKFYNDVKVPKVDPYFLGVWFGDGTKTVKNKKLVGVGVTNKDKEIVCYLKKLADKWGLNCNDISSDNRCPTYSLAGERFKANNLLDSMRDIVGEFVRLPDAVMRGSKRTRLKFLAGFIDSDGHYKCNTFTITQKRYDWAKGIWRLARSLGFYSSIKEKSVKGVVYHRVTISGDIDKIPTKVSRKQAGKRLQKKNPLRTGFTAASIGVGKYYGFTLEGDGRFLLGDYTVTHNTFMGYAIGAHFKRAIGVLVYNSHMQKNWVESAATAFGIAEEDVGIVQEGRCDLGRDVTVMMVQSLLSRDYPKELYKQFGILMADEVNRYGAQKWQSVLAQFSTRYRLGLSATPHRKDGLDQVVYWNFGPVAYEIIKKDKDVKPSVVQIFYDSSYPLKSYCRWKLNDETGKFEPTDEINVQRYRKKLMKDHKRNLILVREMCNARKLKKRTCLIMTHFRQHAEDLKTLFESQSSKIDGFPETSTSLLIGGVKDLEYAMTADYIFTTFSFSRDALNLPHIDTLFFATPPGDVTQPLGRLRDMGPDKNPLLAIDFYERTKYAMERSLKREEAYIELGCKVMKLKRG